MTKSPSNDVYHQPPIFAYARLGHPHGPLIHVSELGDGQKGNNVAVFVPSAVTP